jgi:predicted nucleotide-binding protein (sugar kinase/HSP70/actin superfamily)
MSRSANAIPLPFPQVFGRKDKKLRTILVPNLSPAFARISCAIFNRFGFRAIPVPLADTAAKSLGKKYVHNDICYPAQINIGECIAYIRAHNLDPARTAIALAKNCKDCRAGQYPVLARKALDDAGLNQVAIVTVGEDTKKMHPGFSVSMKYALKMLKGISLIDALEKMKLSVRPYETVAGATDKVYKKCLDLLVKTLEKKPTDLYNILVYSVEQFNKIPVDRAVLKPRVFVIGEILMNYHETANNGIVHYLEKNGFEVVLPDLITFFERDVVVNRAAIHKKLVKHSLLKSIIVSITQAAYNHAAKSIERVMQKFNYYEPKVTVEKLASHIDGMVERTHTVGEGWLIPAEIIEQASHGVRAFVIIQPFGCLPNQVTGKALIPSLKRKLGDVHIISLDYDADTSMANIENRLQMLVMAIRESTTNAEV